MSPKDKDYSNEIFPFFQEIDFGVGYMNCSGTVELETKSPFLVISKICRIHRISKVDMKYRRGKMSRMGWMDKMDKMNQMNKMDKIDEMDKSGIS